MNGKTDSQASLDFDAMLHVKTKARYKLAWIHQAQMKGQKLAEWVEETLNRASGVQRLPQPPKPKGSGR